MEVEELPAELFEFHEVVSHMQEVEEAVVDGHRDFYDVCHYHKSSLVYKRVCK